MNLDDVKNLIRQNMGRSVVVRVYGLRNKKQVYYGTISAVYPNIFMLNADGENKSFSYADVITKEVVIEF